MKTMKWLIRRELWEHKGMLVWTPAALAAVLAALIAVALAWGHNVIINGGTPYTVTEITVTAGGLAKMAAAASLHYTTVAAPLFFLLSFLVFFYCLGALHDERRDRSLLFWKSLPVSDGMTVLSKVALALVVAPLITIAVGIVLALLVLLMGCFTLLMHGVNMFGVFGMPEFYLGPLRLLALLPVYMLWALPTVGWLLLVSSWARSKVFLWAVGLPLAVGLLQIWATRMFGLDWDGSWFMHTIVVRILLSAVPGMWFLFQNVDPATLVAAAQSQHVDPAAMFGASWATLASVDAWVGAAGGAAMIAAATWMRRRREEG